MGRYYLLFEFSDWTLSTGSRSYRAMPLSPRNIDRLVGALQGLCVREARLTGPGCGVRLEFDDGSSITVKRATNDEWEGSWDLYVPPGRHLSPPALNRKAKQ